MRREVDTCRRTRRTGEFGVGFADPVPNLTDRPLRVGHVALREALKPPAGSHRGVHRQIQHCSVRTRPEQ
jgi:hypothetical protein